MASDIKIPDEVKDLALRRQQAQGAPTDIVIPDDVKAMAGKYAPAPPASKKPGLGERLAAGLEDALRSPAPQPRPPGERRGGTATEARATSAAAGERPAPTPAPQPMADPPMSTADMLNVGVDAGATPAAPGSSVLDRPVTDPAVLDINAQQQGSIAPERMDQLRAAAARRPSPEAKPFDLPQNLAQDLREGTSNPVVRGAAAGFSTLGQTGVGAVRLVADLIGADGLADRARGASTAATTIGRGATSDLGGNEKLVADVTSSILNSAPSLVIGVAGGPALKALFAQSTLAEYNAGRDAGFSPSESLGRAGIMGFAEALGERFGFPEQIKLLKSVTQRLPQGEVAKVFGSLLAKEIPGEQLTTAVQFLADKLGPAALAPNAGIEDYLEAAAETLKVTVGQVAVMGGGPAVLNTTRNELARGDAAIERSAMNPAERAAVDAGFFRSPAPVAPTEAVSGALQRFDELAAANGLNPRAAKRAKEQASQMPADQVPGFLARLTDAFSRRGLFAKPVDPAAVADLGNTLATQQQDAAAPAPDAQGQGETGDGASAPAAAAPIDDFTGLAGAAPVIQTPVDQAAHGAATSPTNDRPEPTEPQKEAGNYAKGHARIGGLDVTIENPQGSVRRGVDADGKPWESPMAAHYGYVKGTRAGDGDHSDVFIRPGTPEDYRGPVFVIDQMDPRTGKFDEHKSIIGVDTEEQARALYLANYDASGPTRIGAVTRLPLDAFKSWVRDGVKRRPIGDTSEYKPDLAGTPGEPAAAGAGRAPDAGRGGLDVGRVAPDAGGAGPAPAAGPVASGGKAGAAGDGGRRDAALKDLQQGLKDLGGVLGKAPPAPAAPAVDYPNRKLGFRAARVPEGDEYDGRGMAQIALANAQPGDRLPVGDKVGVVAKVGESTISVDVDGQRRVIKVDSPTWEQMVRDVDGRITASQHGADALDVLKALQRDPAFTRDERGLPMLRDQKPEAPAPKAAAARSKHPKTVMGSPLLARVSEALGGLDPAWIAEFSTRFETAKKGKDGRPIVQWRNPLIPGVGNLFRRGGTQDLQALAELLEREGFLEPGAVEADAKEAGERAKDLVRAALNREEVKTQDQLMAEAQAADDAEREAYYAELDAESARELEAERQAIMAELDLPEQALAAVDDDIVWEGAASTDQAGLMRALGFTEQEIADELAKAQGKSTQGASPGGAEGAGQGSPPAEDRGAAARPAGQEGADEGLTLEAQTTEDLKAKTEREARADELDQRAQVDAEVDLFGLEVQTAPDERKDTTVDLFGGPSADDLRAAADRERAARSKAPGASDLFGEPPSAAAPKQRTIELTREQLLEDATEEIERDLRAANPAKTAAEAFRRYTNPSRPRMYDLDDGPIAHASNYLPEAEFAAMWEAARQRLQREARPAASSDLFPAELLDERQRLADAESAFWKARQDRVKQRQAELIADDEAWRTSPFADRIRAMYRSLADAGERGLEMLGPIASGIVGEAKAGRLNEQGVAHRENVARNWLATIAKDGKAPEATWKPVTASELRADASIRVLPESLAEVAAARINEMGPRLAKLGFSTWTEVTSGAPQEARDVAQQMRNAFQSLMLLGPQRQRAAKGYKNANPAKLERAEDWATEVLGVNTRSYAGVDTSVMVTQDGAVSRGGKQAQPEFRKVIPKAKRHYAQRAADILAATRASRAGAETVERLQPELLERALQSFNGLVDDLAEDGYHLDETTGEGDLPGSLKPSYRIAYRLGNSLHELALGLERIASGNPPARDLGTANRELASILGKSVQPFLTRLREGEGERVPSPVNGKPRPAEVKPEECLLLMPCGDSKRDSLSRADELYTGPMGQTLRHHGPAKGRPQLAILSALHGFVAPAQKLEPYDQRMDAARATTMLDNLRKHANELLASIDVGLAGVIRDVQIVGGAEYRRVMAAAVAVLQKNGVVAPDASIREIAGEIGQQRQQLGQYLDGFGKPAGPAWHTELPTEGLPIEPADAAQYHQVAFRVADDAIAAITPTQTTGNVKLQVYLMPALNQRHGRLRLVPEDQKPPFPWVKLPLHPIPAGSDRAQLRAGLVADLKHRPILGQTISHKVGDQVLWRHDPVLKPDEWIRATIARISAAGSYWVQDPKYSNAESPTSESDLAPLGSKPETPLAAPKTAKGPSHNDQLERRRTSARSRLQSLADQAEQQGATNLANRLRVLANDVREATGNSGKVVAPAHAEKIAERFDNLLARAIADPDDTFLDVDAYNTGKRAPKAAPRPAGTKAEPGDSEAVRKAKADLMAGLGDLASLLSKNTRSNITPEQEQQLLPILTRVFDAAFRLGYLKFQEAAKFVLDQIRAALGDEAADAITLDHLQGSYIGMAGKYKEQGASTKKEVVSVEDLAEIRDYTPPEADNSQQESDDVPGADTDLERDRSDAAAADAPVGGTVQGDGPAGGPQAPVGETGSRRNGRPDEPGVSDGRAAAGREPGDQQVPRGDGPAQPSFFDAGAGDGERSDDPGFAGVPPETVAAGAVEAAAQRGLDDAGKRSRQRAAESVPVALGDLANIRETLPYLLEGQQEDVLKAEQTFAKPNGYGMLFTNGTGTGKTFTGLGVVKRFQRRGITDQLIVVPDEKIMNDWVESGVPLGLTITPLKDTKDKGRGITITTYANLGQNIELVDRDWQHVVADEAHMLMQAEDAKESLALDALRALTWHPRGAWRRFDMLHAEDLALKESLEERIESNNKIMGLDDTMDAQIDSLRRENEKINRELTPLKAKLRAAQEALTAEYEQRKLDRRPRATFLSATPFAYVPTVDWAEGYLFDYAEDYDDSRQGFYNDPNPREQFFIRHFGYRMRTGKLNKPDAKVDTGLMERQFNGWLKKRGVLSSRMLDVAADYDRRFVLVDSQIGNAIDRAIDWIRERRKEFDEAERARLKANPEAEDQFNGYGLVQAEMDEYLFGKLGHLNRRYLLEAIKAKEVIPHIREHLALGRKIVVFHDFNKGGAANPFAFREKAMIDIDPNETDENREFQEKVNRQRAAYNEAAAHFHREFPELGGDLMAELMSPIARFKRDVPGVLIVNGTEKTKDNLARYKQFNDDAQGPSVLLVQSDKNKGWSGHDTTGKHQRVLFNLGLPTQPTKSIQQEGRIYRTGQVSDAMFRYLNTGTNWERWAFAQTIAERASTAENLGMGELARALKDSYISGFEESDDYRAGHEGEGKGGKERDRLANNAISEYDRAKSFYWGTEKKNARTKAREGQDYFATPEPVGLKMVQWSDTRGGEESLEPSGGHGAIARWMGEKVNKTAIEPSNALGSRLAMVFDGKIISGRFEDHHIGNKYDTIVMNPPFGTAGRTAIDHVAQAATHLREWGRIVALIPDGPSAGEKFDKWFYEEADRPSRPVFQSAAGPVHKGDTLVWNVFGHAGQEQNGLFVKRHSDGRVTAKKDGYESTFWENQIVGVQPGRRTEKYRPGEDLHLVAEIKLPGVTFERAATSVRTRVLVIDKLPKGTEPVRGPRIDLSDIDAIDELFDRLEDIEVPARQKEEQPEIPEIAKKGPVTLEELQELESVAKDKAKVYLGQAIKAFEAKDFGEAYAQVFVAEKGWDYQPFRTQIAKLLPRLDKMVREAFKAKNAAPAEDLEAAATAAGFKVMDYVTRKGKTLRVIEAPHLTREQAEEIEGAAWKPSGAKGFYVKVQNVPAMLAKYPPPADGPMFSRKMTAAEGRIRRTIDELVDLAEQNATWRDWYEEHQAKVQALFGPDATLFQKILSATSQMQTVKGNVTVALRAYEQMVTGQPFVGYLPAVIKNLERIRAGQATQGPKISEFERGNLGSDDAMAVDRHIAQLLFNTSTPNRRQIESAKDRIRKVADQLGWTHKQAQAALWAANQVLKGTDPAKVVSYADALDQRADIINALHARLGTGGGAGVSAGRATAARGRKGGDTAFQRRRPAIIDRISREGLTSPNDLRDLLRVPDFGQWAETPLARNLDAAAALRDRLAVAFPLGDWNAPRLAPNGIVSVSAGWFGLAAPGDLTRLAELAAEYDAPVVVRGYFRDADSAVRADELRRAGFEPYRGIQDMAGRNTIAGVPATVAISWVRPGGGISLYTPLFARPGQGEADARMRRDGGAGAAAARAERLEQVNQVVDAITQAWAAPPAVRVVWDLQDQSVDERIRAEDARQRRGGAQGSPLAVFDRGTVYIVASAADSDMDVARSLFHEALGHAGLRAAFGDALKPMLHQLAALNRQAVEAKAAEYGLDMANDGDRLRAAEEVLAELAETRPDSSWVQRAIAAIRTWLRENLPAMFGRMALTDAEIIRTFILPARRAIERGQRAAEGAVPAFLRRPVAPPVTTGGSGEGDNGGRAPGGPRRFMTWAEAEAILRATGYTVERDQWGSPAVLLGGKPVDYRTLAAGPVREAWNTLSVDDPADWDGPMFSRRAPFYSELARQIERSPMNAGTAGAWAQFLKGLPAKGVKPDEITWSGIEEWLALQQGKVTKAAIGEYLVANGVQVEETVLGDAVDDHIQRLREERDVVEARLDALGFEMREEYGDAILHKRVNGMDFLYEDGEFVDEDGEPLADTDAEARDLAMQYGRLTDQMQQADEAPTDDTRAKYSAYVLPGGTNYRELLLTLPARLSKPAVWGEPETKTLNLWAHGLGTIETQQWTADDGATITLMPKRGYVVNSELVQNAAQPSLDEAKAFYQAQKHKAEQRYVGKGNNYSSPHWDDPNVLAHIRVNDRTDADGKRVLFVEEIQSDWAQQGKRQGFQDALPSGWRLVRGADGMQVGWFAQREDAETEKMRIERYAADSGSRSLDIRIEEGHNTAVARETAPRGPFVDKTDKWVALALKRVIKIAVDEGYDRVAFVTGEQSADRYDLSKRVQVLRLTTDDRDGTLRNAIFSAIQVGDGKAINRLINSPAELEDVIGKEMAERLLAGRPIKAPGGGWVRELSGVDLKLGGEGMRAFYDQIVPAAAKDLLRKLGGKLVPVRIDAMPDTFGELNEYVGPERTLDQLRSLLELASRAGPPIHHNPLTGQWMQFVVNRVANEQPLREVVSEMERGVSFQEAMLNPDVASPGFAELLGGEYRAIPPERRRKVATEQPGFDITDAMREKVAGDLPMFARRRPPQHTPEQRQALAKAGIGGPPSARDKVRAYLGRALQLVRDRTALGQEFRQGALDQFFGIQRAVRREIGDLSMDQDPYIAARLANGGTSSVMRALLLHGQARWARNGQHLEKVPGTEGLLDILKPLGDDLNDWFGWMIGNRAERLMREDRENNFTEEDIRALQALATPERLPRFREAARKYAAFKRSVLDVAEGAGLIDPERRAVWDHSDYIPFYREIDDKAIFSPTGRKGLAGQSSGIRVLRGGEAALNDPMENVLMNFSRLIDAALKNNAIRKTIDALADTDAVHKIGYDMAAAIIPAEQVRRLLVEAGTPPPVLQFIPEEVFEGMARMWAIKAPADPDVVRVMIGGKPTFWRVNDRLLLRALTSFVPFDFPGLGLMRGAKRLLTALVTSTPEFWTRNWIRDSTAAQAIAREGFNPWMSVQGVVRSYQESGAFEPMLFAGASFQSGNVNAGDPTGTAVTMRRALRARGLDAASVEGFMGSLVDTGARFWEVYREIGEAIENANREAVYEATNARTVIVNGRQVSQLTAAAYEAKDLMDFSLRGSWPAYQLLADVLPFFNARVQGMYRLWRSDPRRLATVGLMLTAASLLLAMANDGEDWYERLPDWDKDTYWHFRIGGRHFRVPKPFEIGVVFATIPERIGRSIKGLDSGSKTRARLWANVRDQLAVDVVPQLGRPVLDVWTNWDSFRDVPIENMRDEGLPAVARFDARTSDTARVVVDAIEPLANEIGLSPKRLEHLIGGYFGTVGLYALGVSDMLVRKMEGRPDGPSLRADDLPVVRSFYREDPPRSTVFESDLYKMREEVDKLYRWLNAAATKDPARALRILEHDLAKLQARAIIIGATKALAELNRARDEIMADAKMDPEEKRTRIDRIQELKNLLAQRAVQHPQVRAAF